MRPLVVMLTGQQVAWLSKHVAEARAQKADWSMELLADYLVGRSQTGHQYDVAFYGSMLQHHEVSIQGPWSRMRQGRRSERQGNMLCTAWGISRATVPAQSTDNKLKGSLMEPAVLLWQQAAEPHGAAGTLSVWVPLGWSAVRWGLVQQHAPSACRETVGPTSGSALVTSAI